MAKPVGHRRPRKEIPDDMVSCPPTLNLKKASGRKTKQFVNELVEMSPQLSEMGEKDQKGEEDSALGLASMMQSTVSSLGTPAVFKPSGKKIKPAREVKERSMRQLKNSRRSPPRSSSPKEGQPPLPQQVRPQQVRPQHNKSTAQRSNRATAVNTTRQQRQEAGAPVARSRNYRSRRNPSIYSSVHSSLGSSMVSFDSMSQSVYSVYTTATVIARRPAWGHYVVGVMVFFGWTVHHYCFSEYFQPLYAQTTNTLHQSLVKDLILDVSPSSNNSPSMLRGAMQESAVYLHQDFEKRDDYSAVQPVDSAFDTLDGEERSSKKSNSVPILEEDADVEVDSGGPPPVAESNLALKEPPAVAEEEATKKDTDGEKPLVAEEDAKKEES